MIDASVFCAYSNTRDVHHNNAVKVISDMLSDKYGSPITTDYIFDETVTVVKRKCNRHFANEIGNFLLNSEFLVARIDDFIFQKAWEICQEEDGLSFTDCASIAFMRAFGIRYIATFDKGFKNRNEIEVIGK
ncbi:type II toxin-antitoxin system VapC family toxin [Candidatus Woesearchaeota archaeon]|nr:type II toxin-antitoxin system VapC family toxin [Candidatus Woesearchaeota archaeon]